MEDAGLERVEEKNDRANWMLEMRDARYGTLGRIFGGSGV